jgi:phenylalanyl-tRNA synthetase beta subunit
VANKDVFAADTLKLLKKVKLKQLKDTKIVDVFVMNDEQKSITLRSTFLDEEKPCLGIFLKKVRRQIIKVLADGGFPLKS